MNLASDQYKTLQKPSKKILFKEKKSKFFGYAFPISSEEEVKPIIEKLKKNHTAANHVCYAWQLGTAIKYYRVNDDGEPYHSAGLPIYGQIQSFEVTNVLVAVVRIFGGTKLGVGGLISAYKTGAQLALENANIVIKTIQVPMLLSFEYANLDKVMRIIKQENLEIIAQKMELNCKITLHINSNNTPKIGSIFKAMYGVCVENIES